MFGKSDVEYMQNDIRALNRIIQSNMKSIGDINKKLSILSTRLENTVNNGSKRARLNMKRISSVEKQQAYCHEDCREYTKEEVDKNIQQLSSTFDKMMHSKLILQKKLIEDGHTQSPDVIK